MTRIDHTGHNHPNTTAARQACRRSLAKMDVVVEDVRTIDTPVGKVRIGSEVLIEVRGESPARYTVTDVSDDIKNGFPGVDAAGAIRDCWAYADQITHVYHF